MPTQRCVSLGLGPRESTNICLYLLGKPASPHCPEDVAGVMESGGRGPLVGSHGTHVVAVSVESGRTGGVLGEGRRERLALRIITVVVIICYNRLD